MSYQCSACDVTMVMSGIRPLSTWRKMSDHWLCPKCLEDGYVTRTVHLPIVKPLNMEWDELGNMLRLLSHGVVDATNFGLNYLQRNDYVLTPEIRRQYTKEAHGKAKFELPSHPKIEKAYCGELYASIRDNFPELGSTLHSFIERACRSKWMTQRFDVVVRNAVNCARMTYPQPVPCKNDNWKLTWEQSPMGAYNPVMSVKLAGKVVRLALASNEREFGRQIRFLKQIQEGARQGDAKFVIRDKGIDVFIALTIKKDIAAGLDKDKILLVTTDIDSMFVAACAGHKVHTWNDDHIVRVVSSNRITRQRISDDMRFENRTSRRREAFRPVFDHNSRTYSHRLRSYLYQTASSMTKLAVRLGCGTIQYDATQMKRFPDFQWAGFIEALRNSAIYRGIVVNVIDTPRDGLARGSLSKATVVSSDARKERQSENAKCAVKKMGIKKAVETRAENSAGRLAVGTALAVESLAETK